MSYNWLEVFDSPISFLKTTGAWIDQDTSKRKFVIAIVMHCILLDFTLVTQFVHLVTIGKLEEFAETFMMFASFLSVFVEHLSLIVGRKKIESLLEELNKLISIAEVDKKVEGKLKKRVSQISTIFKVNFGMIVLLAVPSAVYSILNSKLPYGTWSPYDFQTNQVAFWILASIQSVGITTYLISICIEALPLFFISFMTGLVEELAEKIGSFLEDKIEEEPENGKRKSRLNNLKIMRLLQDDKRRRKNLGFQKIIHTQRGISMMVKKVSETFETVIVVKWVLTILKLCMASFAVITVS
jgi:hypothetical protein